jgi:hypothetical protein
MSPGLHSSNFGWKLLRVVNFRHTGTAQGATGQGLKVFQFRSLGLEVLAEYQGFV